MKCAECGNDYEPRNKLQKYCSDACKSRAYRDRQAAKSIRQSNYINPVQSISQSALAGFGGGINNVAGQAVQSTLGSFIKPIGGENLNPFLFNLIVLSGVGVGYLVTTNKSQKAVGALFGLGAGYLIAQGINYLLEQQHLNNNNNIATQPQTQILEGLDSAYTINQLNNMSIPSIYLDGEFSDFLGEQLNDKFMLMVYGAAGQGKSHFATQLAKYFSERNFTILYILAEEGISQHVITRVNRYQLSNNVLFQSTHSHAEIIRLIDQYAPRIVIIDSINGLDLHFNQHSDFIKQIKAKQPVSALITLFQVNKDGVFSSTNTLLHETDIEIKIENGVATTGKNRFNEGGQTYDIFPKQADNYQTKVYRIAK